MVKAEHTAESVPTKLMGRHYNDIYSPKVITLIIYGLLTGRGKGLNWHSSVLSERGQQVAAKLSQEWI